MSYSSAELREAIKKLHGIQVRCAASRHNYPVDRLFTALYFTDSRLDAWLAEIKEYAKDTRLQGKPVLHLDVCGNTVATRLGFDHSYQMSMSTSSYFIERDCTAIRLDIFNPTSLKICLQKIQNERGKLTLTTFRPLAGLQAFMTLGQSEAYVDLIYNRLFKQLAFIVEATQVGGYIHLERPFQMDDTIGAFLLGDKASEMIPHITLKKWARKLHCTIRFQYGPFGHKWLLRKNK